MIHYANPWDSKKNIGKSYNRIMGSDMVRTRDYVCLTDGDVMFTTTNYGKQLEMVVARYPECGFFTCYTNRVGMRWQIAPDVDEQTNDIGYHRKFGEKLQKDYDTLCDMSISSKGLMSGMLMMVRRNVWEKVGKFKEDGILAVDNDFHAKIRRQGEVLYLMKGVYVYHWYRFTGGMSHLL